MSTYFQVLAFSIIVPLIFSFNSKIQFYKHWASFFKANILVSIPFIIWDEVFTRNGVWGFNNEHLAGAYLFNLPIEEILFFTIIPYCCVFTFEVFLKIKIKIKAPHFITLALGIVILFLGILFYNKVYTGVTFISLGLLLILLAYQRKEFTNTFYLTYIIITASFFIIVNGVLTGGTLDNPPVWYNNNETLNFRIWTIPIEDFFYSMLLLLSNIWLYEIFKSKTANKNNS
mgnify:CR=1 FL=1|tara:strand:- start:21707 stop:22396 length:690 start_codon:yes stop_codon:yes gene_type:complete